MEPNNVSNFFYLFDSQVLNLTYLIYEPQNEMYRFELLQLSF